MTEALPVSDEVTIPNDSTPVTDNIQIIDEESSLSTATSLTSLITSHTPHTLRTGVSDAINDRYHVPINERENNETPQQRMRSMSVPNSVFLSPEGIVPVRNRSATRSNPRTRTPMRHASPLLVTGRLFEGNRDGLRDEVVSRGRGEIIPEETETTEPSNGIRPGRFLHAHIRPNSTNLRHNSQQSHIQYQLSSKQLPSHRKLRRWNNDRFIGTHSGTVSAVHPVLVKEGEEWHSEYLMPNYPREYRSEFARLVNDNTKRGQVVRDRFLKGEVGSKVDAVITDSIPKQYTGNELYRKLSPRIRSILSRCYEKSTMLQTESALNDYQSSLAIQAITTFEAYITSCIFESKKSIIATAGFPTLLPQDMYKIFDTIFCAPPHLVIKNNKKKVSREVAVIPSIHFYFADESHGADKKRNGAFYRILLYAVCNFHGLVASSFTLDGKKKSYGSQKLSKGVKVVTVQSGIVLGKDLKLLDFVGSR